MTWWQRFKYYWTPLPESELLTFTNEEDFEELVREGRPVVLLLGASGNAFCDKVLRPISLSANAFKGQVRFVRVECARHMEFCYRRDTLEWPVIEVHTFHAPSQTRQVLPFTLDESPYGFRTFFRQHGIDVSQTE